MQPPVTNLVATGEWSKALDDGHGHKLRTRIAIYQGGQVDNQPGEGSSWLAAPVYLEIQDLSGTNKVPTQIYFDVYYGLRFELLDANGATAETIRQGGGGGTGRIPPGFWASVPMGGLLRLRANSGLVSFKRGQDPKAGDLCLVFHSSQGWLILASDKHTYSLSARILAAPADSNPSDHNGWVGPLEFPADKVSAPEH